MSIYQVTNAFAFMIAVGFGVATVTRVSNEVGAGNVTAAKLAADVALELIVGVELIVSTLVFRV
jgi:MATE family multidrug resistance protein